MKGRTGLRGSQYWSRMGSSSQSLSLEKRCTGPARCDFSEKRLHFIIVKISKAIQSFMSERGKNRSPSPGSLINPARKCGSYCRSSKADSQGSAEVRPPASTRTAQSSIRQPSRLIHRLLFVNESRLPSDLVGIAGARTRKGSTRPDLSADPRARAQQCATGARHDINVILLAQPAFVARRNDFGREEF